MSKAAARTNVDDEVPPIGTRLRKLREEHKFSMRELSRRAGVSASLISDVERGRVEPSISVLKRLASALDVTITYFFTEEDADQRWIVRDGRRRTLSAPMAGKGITFELLAPDESEVLEPIYGRYEPGASMGPDPVTHEGEEWGLVLQGRVKVWLDDDVFFLDAGDSIWFPSDIPHRIANAANGVSEYVWVNSPKSF